MNTIEETPAYRTRSGALLEASDVEQVAAYRTPGGRLFPTLRQAVEHEFSGKVHDLLEDNPIFVDDVKLTSSTLQEWLELNAKELVPMLQAWLKVQPRVLGPEAQP